MKKLIASVFSLFLVITTSNSFAQTKDTNTVGQDLKQAGKSTGKAIGKAAKKVGNNTAEVASKGFSKVKDKSYKGKEGPSGETIYIDQYNKTYYVDEKGKKVYISKSALKDKPKD